MKKTALFAVICAITIGTTFGQSRPLPIPNTQSITFSGPTDWTPGTTVSLDTILTFAPYQSVGLSLWLEVPTAIAPFLTISGETYDPSSWTDPNQSGANTTFVGTSGARAGYNNENRDLGATSQTDPNDNHFLEIRDAGTLTINHLSFTIGAGAPVGQYVLFSTSLTPRISEVTSYPDFSDNNIIPPGSFTFNIVPEPSTLALLGLGLVGSSVLAYRRRKAAR